MKLDFLAMSFKTVNDSLVELISWEVHDASCSDLMFIHDRRLCAARAPEELDGSLWSDVAETDSGR